MEKEETIVIFEELIEALYQTTDFCDEHIIEIKNKIVELEKFIPESKFSRELIILLNTCNIAKGDRKEHLKIAIISDLENELRKIKESIQEDKFEK